MPKVGSAAGLLVAGAWTGSGNELGEEQPRPQGRDRAPLEGSRKTSSELDAGQLRGAHHGGSRTRLRVAREARGGDGLDLAATPIQTRTVHAERTMCDRSKACWTAGSWPDESALRRADLVPTVGAVVGLVMAGSWTASGNELDEQQLRPEDETVHLCERPANRQRGLVRGTLEAAPRRFAHPARASQGRSGSPG